MNNTSERIPAETLSYTITGFSQATGISSHVLSAAAKSGALKTRITKNGKRKIRIIMKQDGLDYLYSFPYDEPS